MPAKLDKVERQSSRLLVCIIACFLITTVSIVLVYSRLVRSAPDNHKAALAQQSITATVGQIESVVSVQSPALQKIMSPDQANTIGVPLPGYDFNTLIPYSPLHSVSFTDLEGSNESSTAADYEKSLPKIESILQSAGFSVIPARSSSQSSLLPTLYFQRSDAICQVTVYSLLDIDCGSKAGLEHIASLAEPLLTAVDSSDLPTGTVSIANPRIIASKTTGYNIASLFIFGDNGETKLNLYRQGAGRWQAINLDWYNDPHEDAHIIPNCEDFDSVSAVRQAFAGQACYDSTSRKLTIIDS